MEDEEGYAVLNRQPKQRQPGQPSGAGAQGSHQYPRWIWVDLGLAGAGILVLLGAVIMLAVWVSQLQIRETLNAADKNETRIVSSTECSSCLEDFRSRLKSILCEPHYGSLAGNVATTLSIDSTRNYSGKTMFSPQDGSGCKLCPRDWQLHGDTCYWLSKERKAWTGSREDCSRKSSRMLVIQTQEEMDFIQDVIRGESYIWIGLNVTPPQGTWTWVDGSPLDPARFSVSGPAEGNSCGRLQGTQIQSEICGLELKWICQKEAAMI